MGHEIPFLSLPPLSEEPISISMYSPSSIKGKSLEEVIFSLIESGAIELAPLPSPGFYSRVFVVWKTSGSWRPVIDLSALNRFILRTSFKIETLQAVLLSVRQGDWMVSRSQGPLLVGSYPSRQPQVIEVYDIQQALPVSGFLFWSLHGSAGFHQGYGFRRYLNDWLVPAQSRKLVLQALETVLSLCMVLGIVGNPEKSNLVPSQRVLYLGTLIDSMSFRASLSQPRVEKFLSVGEEFLSSRQQPASSWRVLLGTLSSLSHLVPAARLRMHSLQLTLNHSWDQVDDSVLVQWDDWCLQDISWWLDPVQLQECVSLCQVSPILNFWSDASDMGWGAHLGQEVASGWWSPEEASMSISARELLAVERGLLHFWTQVSGSTVTVFADNSTVMANLRKSGGTLFPALNSIAQRILRWAEKLCLVLTPQFIMGKNNVLADSLSYPNQVQGSEWTLKLEVFQKLRQKWPVMVDLFATSSNHRCSLNFSPFHDPQALGTDSSRTCFLLGLSFLRSSRNFVCHPVFR